MHDLNDMVFFAEVVDHGGFAAAGRALGLPKSKLSRRIAELEARLGIRLLQRTTRKLSMTDAGELYHRHCVAVRDEAAAAAEALALAHKEPRGTVRVTCPVTLAQTTVGPVVPRFLARYPQVRLEMQVTNRVVDLVQEGVDVALRVRQVNDDSGSLVVKPLGTTRALLVASPSQLAREGHPASVLDLARLSTVTMSAVDGRATWKLVGPEGQLHEYEHRPRYTADDLMTLKYAVMAGVGVGMLPDYLVRSEFRQGALVPVLPGWGPPQATMLAVFPSRRGLMPAVRAFLDFLGEEVTQEGIDCPA